MKARSHTPTYRENEDGTSNYTRLARAVIYRAVLDAQGVLSNDGKPADRASALSFLKGTDDPNMTEMWFKVAGMARLSNKFIDKLFTEAPARAILDAHKRLNLFNGRKLKCQNIDITSRKRQFFTDIDDFDTVDEDIYDDFGQEHI